MYNAFQRPSHSDVITKFVLIKVSFAIFPEVFLLIPEKTKGHCNKSKSEI